MSGVRRRKLLRDVTFCLFARRERSGLQLVLAHDTDRRSAPCTRYYNNRELIPRRQRFREQSSRLSGRRRGLFLFLFFFVITAYRSKRYFFTRPTVKNRPVAEFPTVRPKNTGDHSLGRWVGRPLVFGCTRGIFERVDGKIVG